MSPLFRSPLAALAFVLPSWFVGAVIADASVADGLRCYRVEDPMLLDGVVNLDAADLGFDSTCRVKKTRTYCVPVSTSVVSATANDHALTPLAVSGPNPGDRICYKIRCPGPLPQLPEVSDIFGTRTLTAVRNATLCVPAVKGPVEQPQSSGGTCSAAAIEDDAYVLDCDEGSGHYAAGTVAPVVGSPELHIFWIYEATDGGNATVTVEREERTVLVLASFDPVHWTVVTTPEAKLERVIVTGYGEQQVTAPDGVVVENRSPAPNHIGADIEDFADYAEPAAEQMLLAVEQATGLCMTSFHTCYSGTQFRVPPTP